MNLKKTFFLLFIYCFFYPVGAQNIHQVNISYSPGHSLNSFIPSENIGGDIDGHFKGDIDQMLTPANIKVMKKVGLKPLSYRLRTELAGEVWHWNPAGKWSDSLHQQGYWISDVTSEKPIQMSYGYRLPRRGNTHDQANDDGYSRIDDGDTMTFWKSNPYLDSFYTHESNNLHRQWTVVDLGKHKKINAIRIKWGNPYALSYSVDYAKNNDPQYFDPYEPGIWHSFENNEINNFGIKNKTIRISNSLTKARFIRISFSNSSYSSNNISNDIRDKLGFAVNEIEIGKLDPDGRFTDYMNHAKDHSQSVVYVSSTDSWHTAKDLDSNVEQAGIDRFFKDGLITTEPPLIPAALLYDTPENVEALLKHLLEKKYNVQELEMGEEPEGQLVSPEDYAALYYSLGIKIKKLAPAIKMGGPSFASISWDEEDSTTFTESKWTSLFLNYLQKHQGLHLFNFFSFEWYPFDDLCQPSSPQLAAQPQRLFAAMSNIKKVLPPNTPMYVTEYGYSAYEGRTESEIEGGLMYADILGSFLESGGGKSYLYGYEPAFLQQSTNCGYGNNMLLGLGENGEIKYKTASFYIMQMITHFWMKPSDSLLEIFPAQSNIFNQKREALVSAYCLRTPGEKWRLMLINKDEVRSYKINVNIENKQSKQNTAWKPDQIIQYSKQQYEWIADGMNSHPKFSLPPVTKKIKPGGNIILPPYSVTVVF
ncbi:MAG: discoidin domain-containing protein [Ginsengibacter sp.]